MIRTLKEERDKLLAMLNGAMPVGDFNPSSFSSLVDEATLEKIRQKKEEELRAQIEAKQSVESVNSKSMLELTFCRKKKK